MKTDIKIFTYQMFCRYILFLVFLSQAFITCGKGKSVFVNAVLVPIKVMLVKNDYFLLPKLELHSFQQMNGFLYWYSFY